MNYDLNPYLMTWPFKGTVITLVQSEGNAMRACDFAVHLKKIKEKKKRKKMSLEGIDLFICKVSNFTSGNNIPLILEIKNVGLKKKGTAVCHKD